MKKVRLYFLIVCAGILLNSCYDLDTYPGDQLSQGLFWKTEAQVKQGMMGVYTQLKHARVFGYYFSYDILGGIAYQTEIDTEIANGTYSERSGIVEGKWQNSYEGIQRANHFIQNVSGVSFLDEATKAEYIAEARFLRALYYFHLLDFFGAVPYYDETTNVNAEYSTMKKPRSTVDEIRSYIIKDLDEAISTLRVNWSDADYGRATKGAAYALRGKVHLYSKQWKNAIADFEEVVYNKSNNYGYALDPDYARIFKLHGEAKSNEMIFAIQNKGGTGTEYGMKYTIWLGTRASIKNGGWNACTPATDFVDSYECPDGKPFNWEDVFPDYNTGPAKRKELLSVEINGNGSLVGLRSADTAKILNAYKNRDPRLMASVIVPYSIYKGWMSEVQTGDILFALDGIDGMEHGNQANGTFQNEFKGRGYVTYFFRKFVEDNTIGGDAIMQNRDHSPFQFPLIRYADVLLMLSEAYNEDGQLDKAVIELNKVRARASVNMPGLNSGATWLAVTGKDQMAERIRKERSIELAAEGHRFSDMRRWGWDVAKSIAGNAVNIYGETLYQHKFTERDMLWPVPGVEIERNDALKPNNPGW